MTTIAPLFLSHGSPMTALEPGAAGAFLSALGPAIDAASGHPKAILAISAHTLTREPVLLAAPRHDTVHDFYGFPDALYQLRHDSPGEPALAQRVAGLLSAAGIAVHTSPEGGLDHGIWTPLRFAWPAADVPIVPLGFPPYWSPERLFALGRALAPLADEGVLVMASGSITHNLRLVFGGARPALDAPEIATSAAFRNWFAQRSAAADWPALFDYRAQAPNAVLMHPTDEHLLPFYVAAGAAGAHPAGRRLHDSITYGCLGMDAYAFGSAADGLAEALVQVAAGAPVAAP
ncbi:dioxygenase [Ideonella sp. A 288]|uniref:dioxygenase family protein n=1 Tax=Ideonella sp. A 288 TaxID=1962181 RepID=UPI000B4ADAED|nr:class III extradiol ring-cleavage dioxygenase [Ideonella sp. A 288]